LSGGSSGSINANLVILVAALVILVLMQISCAEKKDVCRIAEKNAGLLLEKYDLHPVGEPKIAEFNKKEREDNSYKYIVEIENEASNKIGLNPAKYEKKELNTLYFKLKERAQGYPGDTTATFRFYNKGTIRSAFLGLKGYMPGVVALDNKFFFMPESLKPDRLSLKGLKKIDVFGSLDEYGWETNATLSSPKDISSFTSILEKSTPKKGSPAGPKMGDEEYRFAIYYSDGPVVYATLYSHNSHDILKIDAFYKWYYEPPEELKANIIKLLKK
jgi:hypothetical protein